MLDSEQRVRRRKWDFGLGGLRVSEGAAAGIGQAIPRFLGGDSGELNLEESE
jgi:hypothetical protein